MIALLASLALAQAVAAPSPGMAFRAADVQVTFGPAVMARGRELGRTALEQQRQVLAQAIGRAAEGRYRAVRLVIQDIEPNRPTAAQLGASPALSASSYGVGGAAITGEAVDLDGRIMPVRYRYFPPNLESETNYDTWGDADEAFLTLAQAMNRGTPPDQKGGWPPPHSVQTPTGSLIPRR